MCQKFHMLLRLLSLLTENAVYWTSCFFLFFGQGVFCFWVVFSHFSIFPHCHQFRLFREVNFKVKFPKVKERRKKREKIKRKTKKEESAEKEFLFIPTPNFQCILNCCEINQAYCSGCCYVYCCCCYYCCWWWLWCRYLLQFLLFYSFFSPSPFPPPSPSWSMLLTFELHKKSQFSSNNFCALTFVTPSKNCNCLLFVRHIVSFQSRWTI